MTYYVVGGLKMIPQSKDYSCWYASAQMLIAWRRNKTCMTEASHPDPSEDLVSFALMKKADTVAGAIGDAEIVGLAKRLGLALVPPMSPTEKAIEDWLKRYGPLWTNGKTHIVVIGGIRSGELLVFDPAHGGRIDWRSIRGWYTGNAADSRDTTTKAGIFMYCP